MRIPAAGFGVAGLALLLMASATHGQSLPYAGADAIDQSMPDAPLLPATGLTLDHPAETEQPGDASYGQSRPSDGLGLRIYQGIPPMLSPETERHDENPGMRHGPSGR